jgi:hypothetical protein
MKKMENRKNDVLRNRIQRDYETTVKKVAKLNIAETTNIVNDRPKTPHSKKLNLTKPHLEKLHFKKEANKEVTKEVKKEVKKAANKEFVCPQCNKVYKTRRGVITHIKKCIK